MDKKDSPTKDLSEKQLKELREKNPDINIPDSDLNIDSFNTLLEEAIDRPAITLKEIKKELGIKDADIADIFEYKNVLSYRNSDAKERIDRAIVRLCELIRSKI